MFCSATPQLKKRSGKRAANGSTTDEAEVAGQQHDPLVSCGQLDELGHERGPHVADLGARAAPACCSSSDRPVVPLDPRSMNETPLPNVVSGDQDVRRASSWLSRAPRAERVVVVAVHLAGLPAERRASAPRSSEVEHVARVAERLLAVQVDDRHELVEPVVGGEHHRLPDRALVALGVAEQHARRAGRGLQAGRERRPGSQREAVAERAGGEVDALERVLGVDPEQGPVRAERVERALRKAPGELQGGVEGQRGMALREHEAVAVGDVKAQLTRVQDRHQVRDRQ